MIYYAPLRRLPVPKRILQAHEALTFDRLLHELERTDQEERVELLEAAGALGQAISFSSEELNDLHQLVGPLDEKTIGFAHLLFLEDIEEYRCVSLGRRLHHELFDHIRTPLKKRIVADLVNHPRKPLHLDAAAMNAFLTGNFTGSYPKNTYLKFFQRIAETDDEKPHIRTKGEELAIWIEDRYSHLQGRYGHPLFSIEFDEEQTLLLQRMTVLTILGSKRDPDTQAFIRRWKEGGLYFFSCLCFANHEKEQNRDFWEEYKTWLGLPERFLQGRGSDFYKPIKRFFDDRQILHIVRENRREYVLTFRMHAIVANRPLSRGRLPKLLFKAASSEGIMLRGEEEQRILLELLLDEYVGDVQNDETDQVNTSFYVLPTETAYAYSKNKEQVLDYLLPAYDYLEKRLVGLYDDVYRYEGGASETIPPFLSASIDDFIGGMEGGLVRELGIRQRRSRRKGVSGLYLDIETKSLQYVVQDIILPNKREHAPVELRLLSDRTEVYADHHLSPSSAGSFLLCPATEIPCEKLYEDLTYEFSQGGEILGAGKLYTTPIFTEDGSPIIFPTTTEQGVYCLARPEDIVADELALITENLLADFSLWFTYLSKSTPILLNGIFYGVGKEQPDRAFCIFRGDEEIDAWMEIERERYRIVSALPHIGVRLPATLDLQRKIVVLIDGSQIPYTSIKALSLLDGSGDTYYTLRLDVDVSNATLYSIRVLQGGDNIHTERFFLLRQLKVQYKSKICFGNQKPEVERLSFEDRDALFKKRYYAFPNELSRYKVRNRDGSDGRLILNPPRIDVKGNEESLFGKDLWFRYFTTVNMLKVEHPSFIRSVELVVVDSGNTIVERLKRSGKRWKTNQLLSRLQGNESYLTLAILFENTLHTVCRIHYELSIIEEGTEWITFIPQYGKSIRFSGNTGLTMNPTFHCNPDATYTVHLNKGNKRIASWPIKSDGTSRYTRKDDLPRGTYTLEVVESTMNPFTNERRDTEVLKTEPFTYPIHESSAILSQRPTTYHQSVVLEVRSTMKGIFSKSGVEYHEGIPVINFYLEADRDEFGRTSPFEARGFFINRSDGNRRYMNRFNPFAVKVVDENPGGIYHLEVKDKDGNPLRVGYESGFVNYLGKGFIEREVECVRFSARLQEKKSR